jgi:transposase-like protein
MKSETFQYHKDYGLTDDVRLAAVRDAELMRVAEAAKKNGVSTVSIYNWRKRLEEMQ